MNRNDLQALQSQRGYPALSILLPMHRTRPDNRQDPIRVKNLVKQASERLLSEFSKREAEPLLSRLEALASEIDYNYTLDGLALFVNQDLAQKFHLPFQVKERVVVDQTFATRDLVYALNRSPRYWVLALSEQATRLYEGWRDTLIEVTAGDFPMAYKGPGVTQPMPGGRGINKSAYRDERHRHFFRRVDASFGETAKADLLPLVVVGVDRYLAFFNEVSSYTNLIAATLTGSHDKTPAHELAGLVWPLMQEHQARQREQIFEDMEAAVSAGKYASGIDTAWRTAHEGRGAILVVEEGFHFSARLDASGLHLTPASELVGPEVFDDAVDELIETVLGKNGRVVFVEDGALAAHNRVAMILRY